MAIGGLLGGLMNRAPLTGSYRPKKGLLGDDVVQDALPQQMPTQGEPEEPMSFWQGGSKFGWRDAAAGALAGIADIATAPGDEAGNFNALIGTRARMMAESAKAKREAEQQRMVLEAAQRQGVSPDMVTLQQAGVELPKQPDEDQLTRYMRLGGIDPNSDEAVEMYRQRAENIANPPVWRQGPDGQFYRMQTAEGSGLPLGYDPEEWEPVDGPVAAPTAAPQVPMAPPRIGRTVTSRELNALVTRHGPEEVERMVQTGQLVIGGF